MNDAISRFEMGNDDGYAVTKIDKKNLLSFKIGTVSINKAAGSSTATAVIQHNLGYVPAFLVFFTTDNVNFARVPFNTTYAEEFNLTYSAYASTTELTLSIEMYSISGMVSPQALSATFKYYLFREKASR